MMCLNASCVSLQIRNVLMNLVYMQQQVPPISLFPRLSNSILVSSSSPSCSAFASSPCSPCLSPHFLSLSPDCTGSLCVCCYIGYSINCPFPLLSPFLQPALLRSTPYCIIGMHDQRRPQSLSVIVGDEQIPPNTHTHHVQLFHGNASSSKNSPSSLSPSASIACVVSLNCSRCSLFWLSVL